MLLDFLRIIQFIRKPPFLNNIVRSAAGFYCSVLAKYVQRLFQVLRINIGRAFNETIRTIGKFHQRHSQIFCLEIRMLKLVGIGHYFLNLITHHPAQQIDIVDALIHQAAAVLCPGAPPGCLIIVALATVPTDMRRSMGKPPKASGFQCFADILD